MNAPTRTPDRLSADDQLIADRLHKMLRDSLKQMRMSDAEIDAVRAVQAEALTMRGTGDLPEWAGRDPDTGLWRNGR